MSAPTTSIVLTATMVRDARIRARHGESISGLAREYGVKYHTLLSAVRGRTWTHLDLTVRPVLATPLTADQAGYHHGRRKLTRTQVSNARREVRRGIRTISGLAREFGVKRHVLYDAVVGTTWTEMMSPAPVKLTEAPRE